MKRAPLFLVLFVLACQTQSEPLAPHVDDLALTPGAAPTGIIPGRFIVTLQEKSDPAAVAGEHGVQPQYVYRHALNGFAGAISEAARQGLLRDAPQVTCSRLR